MAAKKSKAKKTKTKSKAKKPTVGESRPRDTIANFVRGQLDKGVDPVKIAEKAREAFPGKKPTVGYVNWIKEHSLKVSTTTQADAA